MVHIHHSQPLKIKFGTNHFFGLETLVPIQYRERVKKSLQNRSDHNITTTMAHNLIIGTMAPYIIWVMQESTKLKKYLTITM